MKITVLPAGEAQLVYRFTAGLAAAIASLGHSVALLDLTSKSAIRDFMASRQLSSPFSQRAGASFVHYANVPLGSMPQEHARALLLMTMRSLKASGPEVIVELLERPELMDVERGPYQEVFGEDEARTVIAVDDTRALASALSGTWSFGGIKGSHIAVLCGSNSGLAEQYAQRVNDFLSAYGRVYVVHVPDWATQGTFSEVRPGDDLLELAKDLLKQREAAQPQGASAEGLVAMIKDAQVAAIVGSAYSERERLVRSLVETLPGKVVLLNAGNLEAGPRAVKVQLLAGFLNERTKAKSAEDVVRLAKRLGEEVVGELERNGSRALIIYSSGITPWVFGYDQRAVSHMFWSSLLNHLRENVKGLQVFIVCDSFVEDCGPVEALAEASVRCRADRGEQPVIMKKGETP